ncbi:DUF3253 domain-containing protein [Paracoccus zeaxanthinifaciens]|uniref:DUF3253 domain-containing protein n=1 Tax=Paracoccus zeaxanthinifaciens TaxID=187400 RepID=UPI0003B3D98F|nr:DUF3253 domain-containing protein [Paracoccus zeaxanthinifaciens]
MNDPSDLRGAILARVGHLRPGTTCCPSQVARDIGRDWRPLMAPLRAEAFRLAAEGRIAITQKGRPVLGPETRGPIRLGPPLGEETHV